MYIITKINTIMWYINNALLVYLFILLFINFLRKKNSEKNIPIIGNNVDFPTLH